jgi:hypothetical protein
MIMPDRGESVTSVCKLFKMLFKWFFSCKDVTYAQKEKLFRIFSGILSHSVDSLERCSFFFMSSTSISQETLTAIIDWSIESCHWNSGEITIFQLLFSTITIFA